MNRGSDRRRVFGGIAPPTIVAVLLAVTATVTFEAAPVATRAAPAAAEALLIGDSVLNGLAQPYSAAGRAELGTRHSFILDTAGCRRLITTSCHIPPSPAPTNAITVLRSRAGQFDRALVVAVGYNDPPSGPVGVDAAVDVILAEAHNQGIDDVIWLTYREAGPAGNIARFRQSNDVLRNRHDPGLHIADWAAASAALPVSWFSGDGIHMGAQASSAMADLIGDALDDLRPTRCTSGVWSGTEVPPGSSAVSADVMGGLELLPAPARAIDTRTLPGKLGAGQLLTVAIAGHDGVPSDAMAAVVSVTAVEPCGDTFLTVFPCGGAPPLASVVNAVARSIVANSAVVALGDGALCVYTLRPTDVLVDVSGWVGATGRRTIPVTPTRLVDTRPGEPQVLSVAQRRLGGGGSLTVDIRSVSSSASVTAATVNVTAADPQASGFVSVLPGPCADASFPPTTSNLNVAAGRNAAASATVGLVDGQFCVFTSTPTDVVVDLQALHGTAGGAIGSIDPRRVLDTRNTTRLAARQSLAVQLGNVAEAAVVNLTAVGPSGSGFLTLYPCGGAIPTASNLNVVEGVVVANRAIVSTGGTGRFCVYTSVETDVVIDVEGYVGAN